MLHVILDLIMIALTVINAGIFIMIVPLLFAKQPPTIDHYDDWMNRNG